MDGTPSLFDIVMEGTPLVEFLRFYFVLIVYLLFARCEQEYLVLAPACYFDL